MGRRFFRDLERANGTAMWGFFRGSGGRHLLTYWLLEINLNLGSRGRGAAWQM